MPQPTCVPYSVTIQVTASPNNSKKELFEQLSTYLSEMANEVRSTGHLCQGETTRYGIRLSISRNF